MAETKEQLERDLRNYNKGLKAGLKEGAIHSYPSPETKKNFEKIIENMSNLEIHIEYIKKNIEKLVNWTEKADDKFAKKTLVEKELEDMKENCEKTRTLVVKAIWTAVLAVLSNLVSIIWFLINNFVIK